jgi:hypothetical protein
MRQRSRDLSDALATLNEIRRQRDFVEVMVPIRERVIGD